MIYQIKHAPLNDPLYRPLLAFRDIKRAEVAEGIKNITYILMYGATPTRVNTKVRDRYGILRPVQCALCRNKGESESHLFFECEILQTALSKVKNFIEVKDQNTLKRAIFTHDFPRRDDPAKNEIKSEILLIYRWTAWRARKRAIYDGVRYTRETLLKSFVDRVRRHAQSLKPD